MSNLDFESPDNVKYPAPANKELGDALLTSLELGELNESLAAAVRKVLHNILQAGDFDASCRAGGFEPVDFLALMAQSDQVNEACKRVVRSIGMRASMQVQHIAKKLETAQGNIQGVRAALEAYKWLASNALPEMLSRAGGTKNRKAYSKQVEEKDRMSDVDGKTYDMGIET